MEIQQGESKDGRTVLGRKKAMDLPHRLEMDKRRLGKGNRRKRKRCEIEERKQYGR